MRLITMIVNRHVLAIGRTGTFPVGRLSSGLIGEANVWQTPIKCIRQLRAKADRTCAALLPLYQVINSASRLINSDLTQNFVLYSCVVNLTENSHDNVNHMTRKLSIQHPYYNLPTNTVEIWCFGKKKYLLKIHLLLVLTLNIVEYK